MSFGYFVAYLNEHKILNWIQLIAQVKKQFHIDCEVVVKDVRIFRKTDFTQISRESATFINMIFDLKCSVFRPIFIESRVLNMTVDQTYKLEFSLKNFDIFCLTGMTHVLVFYYNFNWIVYAPKHGLIYSLFETCCMYKNFDWKKYLSKDTLYEMFCYHPLLNPMCNEHKFEVWIWRAQKRKTLQNVTNLPANMCIPVQIFRSKYHLYELLRNPRLSHTLLLINKQTQTYYGVKTHLFQTVERICQQNWHMDIFEKFVNICRNCSTQEQMCYLTHHTQEEIYFTRLFAVFDSLVNFLYSEYERVFINKMQYVDSGNNFKYRNAVLYHLHMFYLKNKLTLCKRDIEQQLLYCIDSPILVELLRNFNETNRGFQD